MIIDAHQHFWQIDRGVSDWIDDSISGIRRDYLPSHLAPYLDHLKIEKTVLVQASETLSENDFMLKLAEQAPFIGAIVAWLDLSDTNAPKILEDLAPKPLIKGVRPVLQGIEDDDWILQPKVMDNLRRLPDLGLRFDALIQPRHLPCIDKLAWAIPDLPIVVDHAAKPLIRGGRVLDDDWKRGMVKLAKHPQMHCKISGLATEFGPGWSADTLKPVVDHLFSCFGPSRLMWGSDWPVLELDGSYSQWFTCLQSLISDLSSEEKADILGLTAARFYGL